MYWGGDEVEVFHFFLLFFFCKGKEKGKGRVTIRSNVSQLLTSFFFLFLLYISKPFFSLLK